MIFGKVSEFGFMYAQNGDFSTIFSGNSTLVASITLCTDFQVVRQMREGSFKKIKSILDVSFTSATLRKHCAMIYMH